MWPAITLSGGEMPSYRATTDLTDVTFVHHMEEIHGVVICGRGRRDRAMRARSTWEVYHDRLHKEELGHSHEEPEMPARPRYDDRKPCNFHMTSSTYTPMKIECRVHKDEAWYPVKVGSTTTSHLESMYWEHLDDIMDRLMTGSEAEDGRDPGRAEATAYCLAVLRDPFAPDMQAIRAEAVERFQERADA